MTSRCERVRVILADITTLEVDAIVDAAHRTLPGRGVGGTAELQATQAVLALSVSAAANAPVEETRFVVFRT